MLPRKSGGLVSIALIIISNSSENPPGLQFQDRAQGFPVAQIYIKIDIIIYTSTTGIPVSLCSSCFSSSPHSGPLTPQHPPECPQGGIQVLPNPVPCSQALPGELQLPSAPNPSLATSFLQCSRERCQSQASCGREHGKGELLPLPKPSSPRECPLQAVPQGSQILQHSSLSHSPKQQMGSGPFKAPTPFDAGHVTGLSSEAPLEHQEKGGKSCQKLQDPPPFPTHLPFPRSFQGDAYLGAWLGAVKP